MVAFCCEVCPNQVACADLVEAAFARPEDVIE